LFTEMSSNDGEGFRVYGFGGNPLCVTMTHVYRPSNRCLVHLLL
jgi:hypothetical protein